MKKFCKGDENLEDEEPSRQRPEGDNDQLRAIIKADPFYNHTRSWPRIQHQTVYDGSVFEANGRGEKPDKRVLHELTTDFLNGCFEVSSLLILCNNEPCLDWIVTATKSEFYMTTSGDQFSSWTEKQLQNTSHNQTYTPKRS